MLQFGDTISSATKPRTSITMMSTSSTTRPVSDTFPQSSQTSADSILSDLNVKYYLLVLHFRTLYTIPQILTILSHKYQQRYTVQNIQDALRTMYDEKDELLFGMRDTGKVEYAWFPKIKEVKEAEEIEELLKREGKWP
ncbi:MAG: hypothetical protein L6R38_000966 [Xanthoria sp. 2 TBL-2021]|nr:MAG: hypothetical protein L6R38_000966 [Xanthoria sp. 2 TBL-2021]